jgi:hypothetical protein
MIGRGFGAFRARLADRRARLPLGFQMMLGVGGLVALSVLASIAAALVVVGVGTPPATMNAASRTATRLTWRR